MTEISAKRLFNGKVSEPLFCAVDNHNLKNSVTYTIIYKARDKEALTRFMIEKGIWGR